MEFFMRRNLLFAAILILSFLSACTSRRTIIRYDTSNMPFDLEIIRSSREVVLTQTLPWEEQMMGYFKVLKTGDRQWQMWYSSWDNKRKDDYSDYLVYAHSTDGEHWIKNIPGKETNILRGTGHPQRDGLVEQDVFIDSTSQFPYKMIYTAKDSSDGWREKTFVEESKDGLDWVHKKILWNQKHDSQFSVILRNGQYQIYLRHWATRNGSRYRTIGLAITDKDWNTIEEPHNILTANFDGPFPHLYNPGASRISNDLDILFPTFFNEKDNAVKFGLAYVYRNKAVLTDLNITDAFLSGEPANWGIVAPGLVPAGKNSYWLYYYATNMVHSDYNKAGRHFKYFRIKIKVKEK
jgi:hypothetical protein